MGGDITTIVFSLSNPSSNTYALTDFDLVAPSGWEVTNCGTGALFQSAVNTGSGCQYSPGTNGAAINPGSSDTLSIGFYPATGTYPFSSSFTSTVSDGSGSGFYPGPTFKVQVIDPTTTVGLTVTPAGSNTQTSYTAGTAAYTVTATLTPAQAGVTVNWSDIGNGASATKYPSSFAASSSTTGSSGIASTTYQPSNTAPLHGIPKATVISTSVQNSDTNTIVTQASTPVAVSIAAASTASNGVDYSNTEHTTISIGTISGAYYPYSTVTGSLNDAFGNPVSLSTLSTWTITLNGNLGGAFDAKTATGTSLVTFLTCAKGQIDWVTTGAAAVTGSQTQGAAAVGSCPTTSGSFNIPFDFYTGTNYGNTSTITLSISGTTASGSFPTKSAVSNRFITSTFDATSNAPSAAATVTAGNTVKVTFQLTTPQKGVPVTLYLNTATSFDTLSGAADYGANSMLTVGFNGHTSISNTTNSAGKATATFTASTYGGATAYFIANVTAPSNANGVTNTLGGSGPSAGTVTDIGTIASFVLKTYFAVPPTYPTTKATNSTSLYLDAAYSDAYGNLETSCTQANQISINLNVAGVGGGGLLSANPVYVQNGQCDTQSSFGSIQWTMPDAFGTVTVTANAVINGKAVTGTVTVTVVSPTPTLAVTSPTPLNGIIYSGSGAVSLNGWAAVSAGFQSSSSSCTAPNDCITKIMYNSPIGSGSAFFSSANNATWTVTLTLPNGLSWVAFNATDANGFTVSSANYTVLEDSNAPNINFVTAANANISSPATVSANLVDSLGDLNASSVSAVATNVQSSATKTLTAKVTGANNPGHSVTYGVTISGLTTGNWSIVLSASDLAGNSNSSTITVHVTVPFSQSFVVSGTPHTATVGTFAGINASYTNQNPTSQSVVVFAVFKNSAGQTMGIGTGSLTVGAGATQSVFIANPVGLASGTYTVNIFVFTTGNLPVSVTTTISVTV